MRHGIPTAGGFTNQELGVMTGLIDAMTVDVQCIMPAIAETVKEVSYKGHHNQQKGNDTRGSACRI